MQNLIVWLKKWGIIIILSIIILLLLWAMFNKFYNKSNPIEQQITFSSKERILQIEKDSLLGVVYTLQANNINKKNVIDLLSNITTAQSDDIMLLNNILKKYQINKKELESIINIKSNIRDSNTTKIVEIEIPYYLKDSTLGKKKVYAFNDTTKRLKLKGTIDLLNDDLNYSYSYENNLNFIRYKKRKNIFSKTEDFIKITSDDINSNLNISDLSVIPTIYKNSVGLRLNYDVLNNFSTFNQPILYIDYGRKIKGFNFQTSVGLNIKKEFNFSLNFTKKIIEF